MSGKKSANRKPGFFAALARKLRGKKLKGISSREDSELTPFAKIAKEKGFLDEDQAAQLTELASDAGDQTSSDIVVEHDWMTESQADVVCIERARTNPKAHHDDLFRRAYQELDQTHRSLRRLQDVTTGGIRVSDVLEAKKAKG